MKSFIETDLANELAVAMENKFISKKASINTDELAINIIANLNKAAEIFDLLENKKASEIITRILEKIASEK